MKPHIAVMWVVGALDRPGGPDLTADIANYTKAPLGWREGTAVVWAGMRGAVTVAEAIGHQAEGMLRSAHLAFVDGLHLAAGLTTLLLLGTTGLVWLALRRSRG